MGSSEKKQQSSNVSPDFQSELQTMSSQALKATVQQSVRMASQVVEQQSRHGGGFVWRAGVNFFPHFCIVFFLLFVPLFGQGEISFLLISVLFFLFLVPLFSSSLSCFLSYTFLFSLVHTIVSTNLCTKSNFTQRPSILSVTIKVLDLFKVPSLVCNTYKALDLLIAPLLS